MAKPRNTLVCVKETPYYHCIGRCVRRAFLCGQDEFSGRSYEHRRQWIVDRIHQLSSIFTIETCSFAVMSNHYHLVVRLSPDNANNWSQREVIVRWTELYSNQLAMQYLSGAKLNKIEQGYLNERSEVWRKRLTDLSWYMRSLNEYIARKANEEDRCTGRFWEGRFKSQALLDEAALMTCMAYVDLNPIRANMAVTPEKSDYTSVKERIQLALGKLPSSPLLEMTGDRQDSEGLPFRLKDYLELVDWTGRSIRDDKKGSIPQQLIPILSRLNIQHKHWLNQVQHYGENYNRVVGTKQGIKDFAKILKQKWIHGQGKSKVLCSNS